MLLHKKTDTTGHAPGRAFLLTLQPLMYRALSATQIIVEVL